jgi:hypothetical protein
MTALTGDILTAIGRQLSVAYLPTVREPSELKDLVLQLAAFEMRRRGSSAGLPEALELVRAQPVPEKLHTRFRRPAMASDNIFSGLKVVDLASFIAGPRAAVILSDFGADVIKAEPPTGAPLRR